jgi:YbbR domain-containing protein
MKNTVVENLGMKVSAVLIAVFLWFFVTSQGQSEISLEAPVEFNNIPAELGIAASGSKTVTLTIRGQQRFMKKLTPSDIRIVLDMGKAKAGEASYNLNKDDVKLPFAMTVTNISPSSIKIKMEEMMSKPVLVQPVLTGELLKGSLLSVSVEPKTITIRGLRSEVRKVDKLKTEPIDLAGIKENTNEDTEIDTSGLNIVPEKGTVKVKIAISEKKK